jgi:enoyl-CoA hydratase
LSYSRITVEQKGDVLLIGLNRPEKRNAFDLEMYCELAVAYGRLDREGALRCGLLFAHGDHFSAGLDLAQWAPLLGEGIFPALPPGGVDPLGLHGERVVGKPVVAAAQGICLTMGFELLLATDIRVASPEARFAQIEVKRGIYPAAGATFRLPAEIGWGNAMRYLLTGDAISAPEALRLGLIQEIAPAGRHLERALELANAVARQAPLGVQAVLRSARLACTGGMPAAAARLLPDLIPIAGSEDAREGYLSFVERREAVFKGY